MMSEQQQQIEDLGDDAAIVPLLEEDRRWSAYALCDLEPEHRAFGRYIGHLRDGRADAVLLVYAPPGFTSMVPCGSAEGLRRIFATAPDLPPAPLFLLRHAHRPALETRYRVEHAWPMLRMTVQPATLRPAPFVDALVRRLAEADLPELEALYAIWPDTVFTRSMFDRGVYFGAYRDGRLVAASGTHAISRRYGIAVIGNVFTRPDHRGLGLAAATTWSVSSTLIAGGVRDVALNVREDNPPAISSYRRIGFTVHEPFLEGRAALR